MHTIPFLIIFLDIDEVLQTPRYRGVLSRHKLKTLDESGRPKLDPEAVANLNWIIKRTDAKIVVVASERKHFDYDPVRMGERLRIGGVVGEVVGVTHGSATGHRGGEVEEYLTSLSQKPDAYCIIDDSVDYHEYQMEFHVCTRGDRGLTRDHAFRAVFLLSQNKIAASG